MAGSINVNQNNNNVNIQDQNGRLTITDNNRGTITNVTQPVTNIVTVATIGPQGPQGQQGPIGPIPTSGSFSGSFTGSLQGTASYALTASYLQGYISPFPFTGSAQITGSLGVTGSISTTIQFYHSNSLDSSNRTLTDQNANLSIDWNNRQLLDATGQQPNIQWDDAGTFGITTIPIIENFSDTRISNELQDSYDTERIYVSGKILERADIEGDLKDGTLVYYNASNQRWEKFPQTNVSFPNNYLTGSLGLTCNDNSSVLLEGTITAVKNSADPTASFGPTIIDDPSIGSPLFAAGSLSNPTTDTVFSSQTPETTNDTVRILGHVIGKKNVDIGIDSYLIYFNPSNDFYTLSDRDRIDTINGNHIFAAAAGTAVSATSASFAITSSFIETKTVFNQPILGTGNVGFISRSFSSSIGSNSTGETQLLQLPIPANTFSSTDKLSFFAVFSKVGTASAFTVRVKITTSSSMPAGTTSQIAQSANTTAATLYFKIARDLFISSGSLFGVSFINSTITDTVASINPITSTSFDVTQTQYIYVSATPSTTPTADVIRLEAFEIKNI
jgi:hypothetical protein